MSQVSKRLLPLLLALSASISFAGFVMTQGHSSTESPSPGKASPALSKDRRTQQPPILQLHLTEEDLGHFRELRDRYGEGDDPAGLAYYSEHNRFRHAALTWAGRRFPIKIKAHGRSPYKHRAGDAMSYSVKMRNREQLLGAHRFTLTISQRVYAENSLTQRMAATVGVIADFQSPLLVKYNDGPPMPYFFEYRLGDSYMDMIGWPSLRLLAKGVLGKSGVLAHSPPNVPLSQRAAQVERALLEFSKKDLGPRMEREVRDRFLALNRAIVEEDVAGISDFFDPEYLAAFEAILLVSGVPGHGTTNNFIYYDTSSGLFYPVLHRDFFHHALTDRLAIDKLYYGGHQFPLAELVARNDDLRQSKYRIAYQLTEPFEVASLERLYKEVLGGPVPRSWTGFFLGENADKIRALLEGASPHGEFLFDGQDLYLRLETRSIAGLQIESLKLGEDGAELRASEIDWARSTGERGFEAREPVVSDRLAKVGELAKSWRLFDHLDSDLMVDKTTFHFLLLRGRKANQVTLPKSLTLRLRNTITQQIYNVELEPLKAAPEELYKLGNEEFSQDPIVAIPPAAATLGASMKEGRLHVPKGDYSIDEDILLPRGLSVVFEAGARFRLAPGVSILIRGSLEVQGSANEPVTVEGQPNGQPFGTFAALGDDSTRCRLSHFSVRGGSEDFLLGAHYSGQLSLHHHREVNFDHVSAIEGHSDDGANVKYAHVNITNSNFEGNFADQLDLDVVTGLIESSRFSLGSEGSLNGDGLDISFSQLELRNNRFFGLSDKGLSIGENSQVYLSDNQFDQNRLAVAVKGGSQTVLNGNLFVKNGEDVFAYKKQKIFDGGEVLFPARSGTTLEATKLTLSGDRYSHFWNASQSNSGSWFDEGTWTEEPWPPVPATSLPVRPREFDLNDDRKREHAVGRWRPGP